MFNDLNDIQECLRQVWSGYKAGSYDLVTAAITTNTAVNLVRQLERDFLGCFVERVDFEQVIVLFYNIQCFVRGQDPEKREQTGDCINFAMYGEADRLFIPTYALLSSFLKELEAHEGTLPILKPELVAEYDPSEDRSNKDAREKFFEDQIVLSENLPDLYLAITELGASRMPAEDELTSALRLMMETKRIPLCLIFAAQVYLDIHHVMRQDIERGFVTLSHAAKLIEASINQNLDFHKGLRTHWPPYNDGGFHGILGRINDWVKEDPWELARQHGVSKLCYFLCLLYLLELQGYNVPTKPHRFMKHHPWYCGLFTYSLKIFMHDVGIHFADAWGSIMCTNHLYHAVRQETLLASEWADMELLIRLHDVKMLFVGDKPTTPEEYVKKYLLSLGASATSFLKDKRGQPLMSSDSAPAVLSLLVPVSQIFKTRCCSDNPTEPDLQWQDVEKILTKSSGRPNSHRKRSQPQTHEDPNALQRNASPSARSRAPELGTTDDPKASATDESEHWQNPHALTALQLLQSLRTALASETLALTFDHLRLHRTCWILLRQIESDCKDELQRIRGPNYLKSEAQLPFVVGYIFMAGTKAERMGSEESGLKEKKTNEVTKELLRSVAESLGGMVGRGVGGLEVRFLEKQYGIKIDPSSDGG